MYANNAINLNLTIPNRAPSYRVMIYGRSLKISHIPPSSHFWKMTFRPAFSDASLHTFQNAKFPPAMTGNTGRNPHTSDVELNDLSTPAAAGRWYDLLESSYIIPRESQRSQTFIRHTCVRCPVSGEMWSSSPNSMQMGSVHGRPGFWSNSFFLCSFLHF